MSLLRWNAAMSLDGFIAGPDDAMDWVFGYDGPNPLIEEIIASTGALLGDGVRLFGSPPASPVQLELIDSTRAGQLTNLHYRVPR